MAGQLLFDPFLAPDSGPDVEYKPGQGTVAWRRATNVAVVLEVFVREGGTYGFRYVAWVAFRDAGGKARSHRWWLIAPDENVFSDEVDTACLLAEKHASSKHVDLEAAWTSVG